MSSRSPGSKEKEPGTLRKQAGKEYIRLQFGSGSARQKSKHRQPKPTLVSTSIHADSLGGLGCPPHLDTSPKARRGGNADDLHSSHKHKKSDNLSLRKKYESRDYGLGGGDERKGGKPKRRGHVENSSDASSNNSKVTLTSKNVRVCGPVHDEGKERRPIRLNRNITEVCDVSEDESRETFLETREAERAKRTSKTYSPE